MGKKRVIKLSTEEVLKEQDAISAQQQKAQTSKASKRTAKGNAYIQSTYNNTIVTLTDENGRVLAWSSAGALGFKGPKKATPYAASKVVEVLIEKTRKTGLKEVNIFVKGIGSGRESAIRSFAANGIEVASIRDVTPVAFNGPRPKKPRRN